MAEMRSRAVRQFGRNPLNVLFAEPLENPPLQQPSVLSFLQQPQSVPDHFADGSIVPPRYQSFYECILMGWQRDTPSLSYSHGPRSTVLRAVSIVTTLGLMNRPPTSHRGIERAERTPSDSLSGQITSKSADQSRSQDGRHQRNDAQGGKATRIADPAAQDPPVNDCESGKSKRHGHGHAGSRAHGARQSLQDAQRSSAPSRAREDGRQRQPTCPGNPAPNHQPLSQGYPEKHPAHRKRPYSSLSGNRPQNAPHRTSHGDTEGARENGTDPSSGPACQHPLHPQPPVQGKRPRDIPNVMHTLHNAMFTLRHGW